MELKLNEKDLGGEIHGKIVDEKFLSGSLEINNLSDQPVYSPLPMD